jgi:hypothetical protein
MLCVVCSGVLLDWQRIVLILGIAMEICPGKGAAGISILFA